MRGFTLAETLVALALLTLALLDAEAAQEKTFPAGHRRGHLTRGDEVS